MNAIVQLVVMAFLVEAIWETLKMTWQEGKVKGDRIGALFVGILLALSIKADILVAIGMKSSFKYVGVIVTGILISRGSNFMHDLVSKLTNDR